MAAIQIVDGRTSLWQWDTGVRIKVYGCSEIDQMHFVTPGGIISKDLVDSECSVPDAALQIAGLLKMYAYDRTDTGAITRHDFVLMVNARPRPADYIDPPDEYDNLQALADRVAGMITPEAGGSVTAEAITDALGYTPADQETVGNLQTTKADKAYMVELFEELKALILAGNTAGAIAVLDQAILDTSILA